MATGDTPASVPFPRLSQTRREGIPHVPGTTKSWPRRGAGARIIAKEHGLTPAGDAQEIRPSTPSGRTTARTTRSRPAYAFVVSSEPSRPNRTSRKNASASGTTHSSSSSTVQYWSPDGSLTANARTPSPVLVPDSSNNYYQQQEHH